MSRDRKRKLELIIAGDARGAVRSMGNFGDSADRVGGKFSNLGRVATAGFAIVGAAAAGAAVALFRIGQTFDEAGDRIRVGTGATGSALAGLEESFRDVFKSVPADADTASTAIADLNTRLGLTGDDLEDLSVQFIDLSRITRTDVSSNIEAITRVFGDFGVGADEQSGRLDELFRASQATGIGVDALASQMTQFGAPLRALGFGFEESAAMLAKWEKEGVNSEAILAGMKTGLGKMAKAGEAPIDTFSRLRDEMANAATDGDAMAIAVEAFGTRAGPDLALAVREGRFAIDELMETVTDGSDSISQSADDTESFSEKWEIFKNKMMVAVEPVATQLFDALGQGMDALAPSFERFGAWISKNMPGWIEDFKRGIEVLKEWIDRFKDGWQQLQDGLETLGEKLRSFHERFQGVFNAIGDIFGAWADFLRETFNAFKALFTGEWGDLWDALKGMFGAALDFIRGLWDLAWQLMSEVLAKAWEGITAALGAAWDGIKSLVGSGIDALVGFVLGLPGRIADAARGAFDGIKDAFRNAINALIGMWNDLSFTLPSVDFGLGTIGGGTIDTPNLPLLAGGGYFRGSDPRLAVIGEGRADEVVSPVPTMARVIRDELARAGGGQTIVVRLGDEQLASVYVKGREAAKRKGYSVV